MPTVHVKPDSESLLQDVARCLSKARKIVVVTGAGISTNSGIPDFRSDNGLYSLIQAQFDAASKQAITARGETHGTESDTPSRADEQPPAKRRRISWEDAYARSDVPQGEIVVNVGQQSKPDESYGEKSITVETPGLTLPGIAEQPYTTALVRPGDNDDAAHYADELKNVPDHSGDSCLYPADQESRSTVTEASTHPLPEGRSDHPWPTDRTLLKGKRLGQPSPLRLTPNMNRFFPDSGRDSICAASSSPLSSPPVNLVDPYQVASHQSMRSRSSSPSESGLSSRSQSEDLSSASTPRLFSQSSFTSASSRSSLHSMKGKDLFDAQIWSDPVKTSVFYTFATTLRQKVQKVEPTSSHHFVGSLRDCRKLVRCYTQNIDRLEERVGLSTSLALGPGSRYRFSARAGRGSGIGRSSLREAGQDGNSSQADGERPACPNRSNEEEPLSARPESPVSQNIGLRERLDQPSSSLAEHTAALGCPDGGNTAGKDDKGGNDKEPARQMALTSTEPSQPQSTSCGPNRGVECVFLHGSLALLRCFVCGRTSSWDEADRETDTMHGRQPSCPHCVGATVAREEKGKRALSVGKLRPDIVLYGEEHPHAHLISPIVQHDLSLGPDMLLILGTSLRVHGLKVLVKEFAKAVHTKGGRVVFINLTKPPESVWADIIDYWVEWDCDAWVGDLQERKPALWLSPSVACDDDESRTARMRGSRDVVKRKNTRNLTIKHEPSKSIADKPGREVMEGPPPKKRKAALSKERKSKERKLNPNAKRPVAVRDHKLNGAHLVWKIMQQLQRITGGVLPSSATPPLPVTAARSRVRKARKSAPAVLASESSMKQNAAGTNPGLPPTPGAGAPPDSADQGASVPVADTESSISAAVKGRRRKLTAWKMIRGVEVQVPIDVDGNVLAGAGSTPPILPRPPCRRSGPIHPARPGPARIPPISDVFGESRISPSSQPTVTLPPADENGFHETDRLIAKVYDHARMDDAFYEELASRPSTPVQLAPLRVLAKNLKGPCPTKLQPMEPRLPFAVADPAISPHIYLNTPSWLIDPFFWTDPLAKRLEYPAAWQRGSWSGPSTILHHRTASEFGHEEQLHSEHAAAMAVSRIGERGVD